MRFKLSGWLVRSFTIASVLVIGMAGAQSAQAAHKVSICHAEGNGSFHLITVARKAAKAHLRHGDALPGDLVPGDDQSVFAEDCSVIPACPCALDLPSGWTATSGLGASGLAICPDGSEIQFSTITAFDDFFIPLQFSRTEQCDGPTLFSCAAGGTQRMISEAQYDACSVTSSVP